MIKDMDELNHLLFQFADELEEMYENNQGIGPNPNQLADLLVRYHIPVVEYVSKNNYI